MRLVVIHYSDGTDTYCKHADTTTEATAQIRVTLSRRGIAGEWGVILDAANGNLLRRYRVNRRGIAERV
jgi:hypothetical protein